MPVDHHNPIINRNDGTVQVWNHDNSSYYTYSFEFIEDLAQLIQQKEKAPGVTYIDEEA